MPTSGTVLFFLILLLCAYISRPLSRRIKIPHPIILVIIGFSGSEISTRLFHVHTGIHWEYFDRLIFYGLIPVLIFQAALSLDTKSIKNNLVPILCLAMPLALLATIITGALIYFGIDHPEGFPWIAALLTGALLSATDPSVIFQLLKDHDAPVRIQLLLKGESLFSDATAIVLFSFILIIASTGQSSSMSLISGGLRFAYVFLGGILVGSIIGFILSRILMVVTNVQMQIVLSVISAYATYFLAESYLYVSGVIAILIFGLIFGHQVNKYDNNKKVTISKSWEFSSSFCETLIFLMAGITITLNMFVEQWLAMLIGIAAVLVARAIIIFILLTLICRIPGQNLIPLNHQTVLFWGGIKGTVTLALALSLPLSLDYWYTIQSITYGVVIYTLFVNATTMKPVLKIFRVVNK